MLRSVVSFEGSVNDERADDDISEKCFADVMGCI